ncbi:MAG: 30S ribosomal protein S6 [Blastocatellia bacterium]
MRVYEILFIVAPNVEEQDVEALVTQLSDVATGQGAKVTKIDRMGRRRLAYPINKFREGYYVILTIEGTGSEIAEIERRMRVTDTIIRHLSVRIDEDLKRAEKFRAKRAAHAAAHPRGQRGGGRGGPGPSRPTAAAAAADDDDEEEDE